MQTKRRINRNIKILILLLGISFAMYIIEISDWLVSYEIFIDFPFLLTLLGSLGLFIVIVVEIIKHKYLPNRFLILILIVLTFTYAIVYANRNGIFWGKKIIKSVFLDDRSRMDLDLYQNGKFIIYSNWLFGEERFEGKYKILGDTIIFEKFPVVGNDFISKKIIIDHFENKIYFRKNQDGNYDKSFYYFKIK